MCSLSYEHLIGNDDLRLFYDPLLVPVASNDQSNSTATGSLPSSSAERTKNDQPISSPTFLLDEYDILLCLTLGCFFSLELELSHS